MVARQNPLVGLKMDEPTAKYVAILEGTLALYAIQDAKYRALLELITGDSWEDTKIDYDGKRIMQIAEEALVRSGIDRMKAKVVINKRWNQVNLQTPLPPQAVMLEDVVPQQIPPSDVVITKGEMKERLQSWKARTAAAAEEAISAGQEGGSAST